MGSDGQVFSEEVKGSVPGFRESTRVQDGWIRGRGDGAKGGRQED